MVSINWCIECTNFVSASKVLPTAHCVPSRSLGSRCIIQLPMRYGADLIAGSVARAIHCLFRVDFHLRATFPPFGGRMRAVTRFLGILGVLVVAGPRWAAAQHPQTREGFWIGFGFGYGSLGFSCSC